jgi:hypothetical protein
MKLSKKLATPRGGFFIGIFFFLYFESLNRSQLDSLPYL